MEDQEQKDQQQEQDLGVSEASLSLARIIDRLPLGNYLIDLDKRAEYDGGMQADVSKKDRVRRVGNGNGSEARTST